MSLRANARAFDLAQNTVRELNAALHQLDPNATHHWRILNPKGRHSIAAGLDADATVEIEGHVGYYCAGMNKRATVLIKGNAGVGVAENMMSGLVHVQGDASQSAGATANGGLLVIDGSASARCGISLMGGFMAQAGSLVVLGDAGEALGDSLYEAKLFVRGKVQSLGADCVEKKLKDKHREKLYALLKKAGIAGQVDIEEFRRYGSARRLYHFHVDNASAY